MSAYPPKLAQRFLVRLVPSGIVGESIVGDAHEEYLEQIARVGSMRARLWYWSHVLNIALKYRNRRTTESAGHGGSGTALAGLAQDFRFTWRSLGRSAAFTSVVVGTLGIGIGATTAIFSVVNGVLLKPLPFPESDRLVTVWLQLPGIGLGQMGQARATYFTFRDEQRVLEDIGLWRTNSVTITGLSEPEVVPILQVTDGTLPLLGTQPVLGRRFTASDDTPGTPLTVMLSHGFWQRHYGGDPGAIGQMLTLEDTQAEIIGVLPPEFQLMWSDPAFVLPLRLDRSRASVGAFNYPGIARLKPGVTLEAVQADLTRLIPRAVEQYPGGFTMARVEETQLGPLVVPLIDDWVGGSENVLWFLFGAVGLVLVIACANVANLLLVRAEGRHREIAVRTALGARRLRLAREFLVESFALALGGGAIGVALAYGGIEFLKTTSPGNIPRLDEVGLDVVVLAFALAITLATALVFGAIPVVRSRRTDPAIALDEGGRGGGPGKRTNRVRSGLVITQMAIALVLLISSGLMLRSLRALWNVPPGFANPETILAVRLNVSGSDAHPAVALTHEQIAREIERIPGVTSVGVSTRLPMNGSTTTNMTHVQGITAESPPSRRYRFIGENYFETMNIPVLAGRTITWSDVRDLARVAIVNERFASEYWDDPAEAVGKMIAQSPSGGWRQIIGVVGNVRDDGLSGDERPLVYWPMAVDNFWGIDTLVMGALTYAIRTEVDPLSIVPQVRAAVWSVNPNMPLSNVQTQQHVLEASMATTSFTLTLLGIAATIAMILGFVGLYGVMAYAVSTRRHEIGIRMALGAKNREIAAMMVRRGLVLAVGGVAVGLLAAVAATRLMTTLLFGVEPVDLVTYGGMAGLLTVVALLASYLPARRAASLDPVRALRDG